MVGTGWQRIGFDPALADWARAAHASAAPAIATSAEPWRCGNTWFVGVDALPNDAAGQIGSCRLPWQALPLSPVPLHRAQVSLVRPTYPQPSDAETEAAFGYRLHHDAAHLDGLLADAGKRRFVRQPHGWILGLPLNACDADAAPLVVWEGSHRVMRAAMQAAFAGHAREDWGDVDVTSHYVAARKQVFESCRRIALPAGPGEATLLHRHCLHGVAPWRDGAKAPPEGRMIAYFRPGLASVHDWLMVP